MDRNAVHMSPNPCPSVAVTLSTCAEIRVQVLPKYAAYAKFQI